MTDAPPFVVAAVKMVAKNLYVRAIVYEYSWQSIAIAAFAWSWLIVGLVWAVIATPTPWGAYPFPSMVGYIWCERPEVDGQRTLPLWMAVLILPAAVFEFGARNCYFVGYTVVTLIVVPLKVLKGLLTFDLSRLAPSGKLATSTFKDAILRARVYGRALFFLVVIVFGLGLLWESR